MLDPFLFFVGLFLAITVSVFLLPVVGYLHIRWMAWLEKTFKVKL